MEERVKIFLLTLLMFILVDSSFSNAQPPPPYPCDVGIVCPSGCQQNGIDCWDPDDPVPLDNGLILLSVIGITFGLYKLNCQPSSKYDSK